MNVHDAGDFEEGFEEYDRYGQRGMDGGKDPALEPAVNGYIAFENGISRSTNPHSATSQLSHKQAN